MRKATHKKITDYVIHLYNFLKTGRQEAAEMRPEHAVDTNFQCTQTSVAPQQSRPECEGEDAVLYLLFVGYMYTLDKIHKPVCYYDW